MSQPRPSLATVQAHLVEIEKHQIRMEGKLEGFTLALGQHIQQAQNTHQDQENRLRDLETESNRSFFTRDLMGKLVGYVIVACVAAGLALMIGRVG